MIKKDEEENEEAKKGRSASKIGEECGGVFEEGRRGQRELKEKLEEEDNDDEDGEEEAEAELEPGLRCSRAREEEEKIYEAAETLKKKIRCC